MKNKRGQTEIMGLVIIVIIITLAMLFYVSSAVNKSSQDSTKSIRKEFAFNEQATSFIDVLLATSVCDVTMNDLILDCGTTRQIICQNGLNSCRQIQETVEEIKTETLDIWGQDYTLTIDLHDGNPPIEYTAGDCSDTTVGKGAPGIFLIPYYPYPGSAEVELGICRSI